MKDNLENKIQQFFSSAAYAVVGASTNRDKYGNKVLRVYQQNHKAVYPVNPKEKEIEGLTSIPSLADLPHDVKSISIITPPPVTEKIVDEAIKKGIENIWMQPGAESEKAIRNALDHGINVIANGPCILVVLGFTDDNT